MILARYLLRELLANLCIVTCVLLLASVGARFLDYLAEAAQGGLALSALWQLLALRVPLFAQLVVPLSLFIAILLTLGRASSDLEIGAMHAAGASPLRVAGIVLIAIVPVALLVGALSLRYAPAAALRLATLLDDQRRMHDFDLVVPRRFIIFGDGRRVSYIEAVRDQGQTLQGVFIAEKIGSQHIQARRPTAATRQTQETTGSAATPMNLIWASSGQQQRDARTGAVYLALRDGRRLRGTPGDADFQLVDFAQLGQRLPQQHAASGEHIAELRATPTAELLLGGAAQDNAAAATASAELHWRWSLPLFALVVGLLGIAVGQVAPRTGRFARVAVGLVVFLIYLGVLFAGRDAMDRGAAFAGVGLWWLHAPFALAAGGLLLRQQWRAA